MLRPLRLGWCLFVCLCLGIGAGTVWIRLSTVKDTYRYVTRERELRRLQQEIQERRVAWLQLSSPGRLSSIAIDLGMRPPLEEQLAKIGTVNGQE